MSLADTPMRICPNEVIFSEIAPTGSYTPQRGCRCFNYFWSHILEPYVEFMALLRTDSKGATCPFSRLRPSVDNACQCFTDKTGEHGSQKKRKNHKRVQTPLLGSDPIS